MHWADAGKEARTLGLMAMKKKKKNTSQGHRFVHDAEKERKKES
jgi:hypothetical protein